MFIAKQEIYIMQGCLPMFVNGHANIPESMYNQLILATDAINIAFKVHYSKFYSWRL